ncbi:hypothetical protein [Dokdonella soli]
MPRTTTAGRRIPGNSPRSHHRNHLHVGFHLLFPYGKERRPGSRATQISGRCLCFQAKERAMRSSRAAIWFAAAAVGLGSAAPAFAQDGGYDGGFGVGGRLLIDVSPESNDRAAVMRVLPNGSLLMAGTCTKAEPDPNGGTYYAPTFCATQLTPDGSYDGNFGPGGVGYLRFDRFNAWPNNSRVADVLRLNDGRLLFMGSGTDGLKAFFALLTADGSALDPSVGSGYGFFEFQYNGTRSSVVKGLQQADGKILVAGSAIGPNGNTDMAVARFLADFSALDPAFGNGGYQTVAFDLGGPTGDNSDAALSMTLQRDGAIVLAGYAATGTTAAPAVNLAITRLRPDGQRDITFGPAHDGRVHLALAPQSAVYDIVEDRHGRLVIAGVATDPTNTKALWMMDRLLSDGSQDAAFNSGVAQKFLILDAITGGSQAATRLALQSDGRILAGGTVARDNSNGPNQFFGVARLNQDGSFDTGFGAGNGRSYGLFGFSSYTDNMVDIAIANGGLMLGGWAGQTLGSGDDKRFGLVRLKLDLIFHDDFE